MNKLGFTNINHVSFEGYIAGRMFVLLMENAYAEQDLNVASGSNVTDDFVPTLYRQKYLVLDDVCYHSFLIRNSLDLTFSFCLDRTY
jgi:hypothetical protein